MLISELRKLIDCDYIDEIICEREFDRFARITSITTGKICVYVTNKAFINDIPENAVMVITSKEIANMINSGRYGFCISSNPKATYFKLFNYINQNCNLEICENLIGVGSIISDKAYIASNNVRIGKNTVVEEFVSIYENVSIGDNCTIRSGAKIGIQDYNLYNDNGDIIHLHHAGRLEIGNNVEVGFNSVIGKSLYKEDTTKIGDNCKLSNMCAVGHDVRMGNRVMIYSGTSIGGYVNIGDDTHITMNAVVKNNINIGSSAMICMGSTVVRDVADGETVFGNPAKKIFAPKSD